MTKRLCTLLAMLLCMTAFASPSLQEELKRIGDAREQIIQLLSKDLRNPANAISEEIAALSASAASPFAADTPAPEALLRSR